MNLFDYAQFYYDRGFSLVPQVLVKGDDGKVKKLVRRGLSWKPLQKKRISKADLITKWYKYLEDVPGNGIAVICGQLSNILIVDIDDEGAQKIVDEYLPKDFKTVTVRSGSGNKHLWFKHREGLRSISGLGGVGLDIKTEGGLATLPGSIFPCGSRYTFVEESGVNDTEIKPMPNNLFNKLVELIGADKGKEVDTKPKKGEWFHALMTNGSDEGARTKDLVRMVGYLFRENIRFDVIMSVIKTWNTLNVPPLPEHEVETQVRRSLKSFGLGRSENLITEMNKKYGVVIVGGSVTILRQLVDEEGKKDVGFMKPDAFKLLYANNTVIINKKHESVAKLWLEHPERKTYRGVIFDPAKPPGETENVFYNLWSGFAYKPKKGDWSKFREHIEKIVAPTHSEWILAWMARIIQAPGGRRPGTVLCLRGGYGSGKSFFCEMFGKLFGKHFYTIDSMDSVVSEFNHQLKDTVFLSIDDATWGGDKKHAGKLRSMVTSEFRTTQPKFVDAFQIKNHLNIVISSNLDWMIPAGLQERRFLILDVSEEKRRNVEYFEGIREQLRSGGYEAMLYDLLEMDISGFNLREIPKTLGTRDNIIGSLDLTEQFWLHRLEQGTLVNSHKCWRRVVIKQKLYGQYENYCRSRGKAQFILGISSFYKSLNKLCPSMMDMKKRCCPIDKAKQFRVFIFPGLEEARKEFDKVLGVKGKWDEILDEDPEKEYEDCPSGDGVF